MSDWVRFHGELRKGEKRGLSRASRFVYMELSHEARALRGVIYLPKGMADLDGLLDVLGGNRREVVDAAKDLTEGEDPMIAFRDIDGKRAVVVLKWTKWNPSDPTGSERQARYRNGRRNGHGDGDGDGPGDGPGNGTSHGGGDGSRHAPSRDVTHTSARARATLPLVSSGSSLEEPRETREAPSATRLASAAVLIQHTDALPPMLRDAAAMLGVRDIPSAWLKFTSSRNGRMTSSLAADWQGFCASWRAREATELARRPIRQDPDPVEVAARRRSEDEQSLEDDLRSRLAKVSRG